MRKLLFLLTMLVLMTITLLPALVAGENLLNIPPIDWKRDFRPGNRSDIYNVEASNGVTRIRRYPSSTFGRIYHDLKLKPGVTYRLRYLQTTEHGVLTKMLVIYKGQDGKWREKTRLSYYEPMVNGEWCTGVATFTVPEDVILTRIDYRIDSFGTVDLKDVSLTELSPAEAAAYKKSIEIKPFQPGNGTDYALKSGQYYRVRLEGNASGKADGTVKLVFHSPEGTFIQHDYLTFFLRGEKPQNFSEVIVIPDNADGARVTISGADVKNFSFEPFGTK